MLGRVLDRLGLAAFLLFCLMAAFGLGYRTADKQTTPYQFIDGVLKSKDVIVDHFKTQSSSDFLTATDIPVAEIARRRITPVAPSGDEALLFTGGPQRYLEFCPGTGCLAVILDRGGKLVHAYPFRPEAFRKGTLIDRPYQEIFANPELNLSPFGLAQFPGGDLIVTLQNDKAFPTGAGVARIGPDGRVIWYRRDYTHHWPTLLDSGEIALTSADISQTPVWQPIGGGYQFVTGCRAGYQRDKIEILDQSGRSLQTFKLLEAVLASRWRNLLIPSNDPFGNRPSSCDPLHTNFVRQVGPEMAARFADVTADDLLVSLRNISAVGILDRASGKFTHMIQGSFHFQHSAQPIAGGRMLVFDDLGASADAGPSRVMVHDPATGAETTVFPGPASPLGTTFFSTVAGNIDVSPDGQRMLVAVTEDKTSYEVELATGRVLTRFDNLHDLSSLKPPGEAKAGMAGRFRQTGIYYAHPPSR